MNRRLFPELDLLPTRAEQRRLLRSAIRKGERENTRVITYTVMFLILQFLLLWAIPPVAQTVMGRSLDLWHEYACVALATIISTTTYIFLTRSAIRRYLREELRRVGFQICVNCGYDLRGQTDPRCPECGAEFCVADTNNETS